MASVGIQSRLPMVYAPGTQARSRTAVDERLVKLIENQCLDLQVIQ